MLADLAHDLTVVLTTVGHARVGRVGHLQRERAHRIVEEGELRFARRQLVLELLRDRDLGRALVGRGSRDLLARRVLARPQLLHVAREPALLAVEPQQLVEQPVANPLALDAAPVVRVVAQAAQVDHAAAMVRATTVPSR